MLLTASRLKELIHYDPSTGVFTNRVQRRSALPGSVIAGRNRQGYVVATIDRVQYKAHRLAWLYAYGEFPELHIDHINGIRDDNRLSNLRQATFWQNRVNSKVGRGSTGTRGVYPAKNKFAAKIVLNGVAIYLGLYNTVNEANMAYEKAQKIHHFSGL